MKLRYEGLPKATEKLCRDLLFVTSKQTDCETIRENRERDVCAIVDKLLYVKRWSFAEVMVMLVTYYDGKVEDIHNIPAAWREDLLNVSRALWSVNYDLDRFINAHEYDHMFHSYAASDRPAVYRRMGRGKRLTRRPYYFDIPVKFGLYTNDRISTEDLRNDRFRVHLPHYGYGDNARAIHDSITAAVK